MILAIDPGTFESGFVTYDELGVITSAGVADNDSMLLFVSEWPHRMAIERFAAMGMAIGAECIETIEWTGRFRQAYCRPDEVIRVYRRDVKLFLCGTTAAKDANVRQALIDKLGPQGTKKNPGPTYGVRSHAWAALGVALTALHSR